MRRRRSSISMMLARTCRLVSGGDGGREVACLGFFVRQAGRYVSASECAESASSRVLQRRLDICFASSGWSSWPRSRLINFSRSRVCMELVFYWNGSIWVSSANGINSPFLSRGFRRLTVSEWRKFLAFWLVTHVFGHLVLGLTAWRDRQGPDWINLN